MRHLLLAALLLALARAQPDDYGGYGGDPDEMDGDMGGGGMGGDMGGGMEEGGGGGGGGGGARELLSVEDFDEFLDDNDASVIATFTSKEIKDPSAQVPDGWDADEDGEWEAPTIQSPSYTTFQAAASSSYNYRFAYVVGGADNEVRAKMKAKTDGLYLFKSPRFVSKEHGDRPRERYPSSTLSEGALQNWLKAKAQPLVGEYSYNSKTRYASPVLVVFMNLDWQQNAKSINYVLKRTRKAAAAFKAEGKKLSVALASTTDMLYDMNEFGLKSTSKVSDILMGISDPAGGKFYRPANADESGKVPFSAATMGEFAASFLKGELTPYEKPEEPPPADGGADPDDPMNVDYGDGDEEDNKEEM